MKKPPRLLNLILLNTADNLRTILAVVLVLVVTVSPAAEAQTLTVLHAFTGERDHDGSQPIGGVVIDRAGNLYGVAYSGGLNGESGQACYTIYDDGGCGTVFKLARHGSGWVYSTLYRFQAPPDGNQPAGIVIAPDGTLYGATYGGGLSSGNCMHDGSGCGIVFRLQPPATFCSSALCTWSETVVHAFTGQNGDGGQPGNGDLLFDNMGKIYGTTIWGGENLYGTVYTLTPSQGGWTENVVYSFNPLSDNVGNPGAGVIMDATGNLYGSSGYSVTGENANGGFYQLVPSQSGWTANPLQIFQCVGGINGCYPDNLMFDAAGNIVAPMNGAGFYGNGTVVKLLASQDWSLNLIYTFLHGQGPSAQLTSDAAGNLYGGGGTCANGFGCIYKLTATNNGYVYTDLYDFHGGSDGRSPYGHIAIDANGNLYGTAETAGNPNRCLGHNGCGTVWELTP